MILPDFADFLETLTPEKTDEMFGDISSSEIYRISDYSPETISALLSSVAKDAAGVAISMTLRLLQTYHEWLQEQTS